MGIFLTCLSVVLAYFSPKELLPSLAPLHLQPAILAFALAATFTTFTMRPIRSLQTPHYLLLLAFWAAIIISHFAKFRIRWAYGAFYTFGFLVAIYFLVHINVFSLARIRLMGAVLIACGTVLGLEAIAAYHTGYLGSKLLLYGEDDPRWMTNLNRVRAYGVLQDPNDFAQFLLVCLALLGLFWKPRSGVRNMVLLSPIAAILTYTIYLTFSRGALLGFGAIVFVILYRPQRKFLALVLTPLLLLGLYGLRFTGGRAINMEPGRIIAWGAGITSLISHPAFGVGFGRFTDVNDLTAHNSFVLCFTELGLFGYFFWLALIIVTLSGLWIVANIEQKTQDDRNYVGVVRSLQAATFAFLVTAWFLSRTYNETLYILLALAASVIQLRRSAIPAIKLRLGAWMPRLVVMELLSIVAVYVSVKIRLLQ